MTFAFLEGGWSDAVTFESLLRAANFVRESRRAAAELAGAAALWLHPWQSKAVTVPQGAKAGDMYLKSCPVKIGGVAQSPTYPLAPNQSVRVSFPGVDSGPVEVRSSNGQPIIAALRINLKVNSPFTSYSEFLGLSASSTASTRYLFPWYNNTGLLDSQLRFARSRKI